MLASIKKKKRHKPIHITCQVVPGPSLSGKLRLKSQAETAFPGGSPCLCLEQVAGAGRDVKCNTFFPFSFAGTVTRTRGDCDNRPMCRVARTVITSAGSRRHFARRGLLQSFLFQRVPVIAVVVMLSVFFFLALLFVVKMKTQRLCVVLSAGAPLLFAVSCHSPRSVHNFLLLQCWPGCFMFSRSHFFFFFMAHV